ncbi:MAG: hypothetical protein K6E29_07590 [Cyanobacteria bacterium RUI128]|nr:hypothetical protein [Cyanobacteria bacterium RUI128]
MTTLSAYCQSMGWDLNDPAIRAKVQSAVGNIGDNTELNEAQMDKLQEALYNALGAQKPGDDPMLDTFGGTRLNNGDLHFNSNQDALDYLNATTNSRRSSDGSFLESQFIQQPISLGKGLYHAAKDGLKSLWNWLTE